MDPEVLASAKQMAQEESLNVRLAILREKYGVKQNEIATFTGTGVSELENRKDIRLSTLIDYLDSLASTWGWRLRLAQGTLWKKSCYCGYKCVRPCLKFYLAGSKTFAA
jgi:hypothetical protein